MTGPACVDQAPVFHAAEQPPHRGRRDLVDGQHRPVEAAAVRVCLACPLLEQCCRYALTHDVSGVCGGLTRLERLRLRKQDQTITYAERQELYELTRGSQTKRRSA